MAKLDQESAALQQKMIMTELNQKIANLQQKMDRYVAKRTKSLEHQNKCGALNAVLVAIGKIKVDEVKAEETHNSHLGRITSMEETLRQIDTLYPGARKGLFSDVACYLAEAWEYVHEVKSSFPSDTEETKCEGTVPSSFPANTNDISGYVATTPSAPVSNDDPNNQAYDQQAQKEHKGQKDQDQKIADFSELDALFECPISNDPFDLDDEAYHPVLLPTGQSVSRQTGKELPLNPYDRKPLIGDLPPNHLLIALKKDPYQQPLDPITENPIFNPVFLPGTDGTSFDKMTDINAIRKFLNARGFVVDQTEPVANLAAAEVIAYIQQHQDQKQSAKSGSLSQGSAPSHSQASMSSSSSSSSSISAPVPSAPSLEKKDNDFEFNLGRARVHLENHEVFSAQQYLVRVCDPSSDFNHLSKNEQFNLLTNLADLCASQSQHDAAIQYIDRAVQLNLNTLETASYYIKLGDLHRIKGRMHGDAAFRSARENYRSGFEILNSIRDVGNEGERCEYRYLLATLLENELYALEGIKKPNEADMNSIDMVTGALAQFPNKCMQECGTAVNRNPLIYLLQGKVLFQQKNYAASLLACEKAYAIVCTNPKSVRVEYAAKIRQQYALALIEGIHQNKKTKIGLFQTLAEYLPSSQDLRFHAPKYQLALTLINEALFCQPNNRAFLKVKIKIYLRLGQWDEAIKCCRKSLAFSPNDNEILLYQIALLCKKAMIVSHAKTFYFNEAKKLLGRLQIRDASSENDITNAFKFHELMNRELNRDVKRESAPIITVITPWLEQLETIFNLQSTSSVSSTSLTLASGVFSASSKPEDKKRPAPSKVRDSLQQNRVMIESLRDIILADEKGDAHSVDRLFTEYQNSEISLGVRLYRSIYQFKRYLNGTDSNLKADPAWEASRERHRLHAICDQMLTRLERRWQTANALPKTLSLNAVLQTQFSDLPDLSVKPKAELRSRYAEIVADPVLLSKGNDPTRDYPPVSKGSDGQAKTTTHIIHYGVLALPHHTIYSSNIGLTDAMTLQAKWVSGKKALEAQWEAKMIDPTEASQQLANWESDVRQMFLGHPDFPNPYELYAALSKIVLEYSSRASDMQPLLDSMLRIEKNMRDKGLIHQQLDCMTYARYNQVRATRKPNAFEAGSGTQDTYRARYAPVEQPQARTTRFYYSPPSSPGGGC